MKLLLKAGTTSKSIRVFLQDSTSTTGAGLTGLTNASSGLTINYIRDDQTTVAAVAPQAMTIGTWVSGGFVEVNSSSTTGYPGLYEIGLPDAALASGKAVQIVIMGAANLVPCVVEIELTAVDHQDGVRFGLTALPNVAQGNSGALAIGNASGQVTLTAAEETAIANALLDLANGVETGETVRQFFRMLRAFAFGVATDTTGTGTSGTVTFMRKDGTTTSLTVAHDNAGNRTSSTPGTN